MRATITIKLSAETKGEMIDTFGGSVQRFRESIEAAVAAHGFAGLPPDNVELRWLVVGGRWVPKDSTHHFAVPVLPDQEVAHHPV